ncbi:hypothetical protein CLV59_101849 [Chitinophaga dinghuensis]|uniref:Gluconate 2-dehydrogenase subunit 3-like protein n=1 Tax=Chitinophaga dinghuensis TaxID=1539050 RepID=A0A327WJW1_9BACT|nr:hypothetical protein [Chitinophaga dinghuensis]RAJ88084.1 hypothetical protein CLV59_101849 [Chitinophaga dinghuensis]
MRRILFAVLGYCAVLTFAACGNRQSGDKGQQPDSLQPKSVQAHSDSTPTAKTDEAKFRVAFAVFQQAVKNNDSAAIRKIIHFPLQTAKQWTNEDLKSMEIDKSAGIVHNTEFSEYYSNIFHPAVMRLIPKAGEENLQEIDDKMDEDYYNTLRQGTDKGAKLYEVYEQYPEKNGSSENFFAFVFARIGGEYRVVAYYAKWPVKG